MDFRQLTRANGDGHLIRTSGSILGKTLSDDSEDATIRSFSRVLNSTLDNIDGRADCRGKGSSTEGGSEMQKGSILHLDGSLQHALEGVVASQLRDIHDYTADDVGCQTAEEGAHAFVATDSVDSIEAVAVGVAVSMRFVQVGAGAH